MSPTIEFQAMRKGRKPCCDKSKVKKGPWTPSEDSNLITFIHNFGHSNWRTLPSQAGLLRCGKSCRLRWINYLRPDVKRGNFTATEEEDIIKLHQTYGNKWSKIASFFPGRTDNEIKNIWNTHLIKKLGIKSKKRNTSKRLKSKKPSNGSGAESPSAKSSSSLPYNADQVNLDSTSTTPNDDVRKDSPPTPLLISCNSDSSSNNQSHADIDMSFGASTEAMHLEDFGAFNELEPLIPLAFDGLTYWNLVELDNLCSLQTAEIEGYPFNAFEEPRSICDQNNQIENWARNLEIELGLDDIH